MLTVLTKHYPNHVLCTANLKDIEFCSYMANRLLCILNTYGTNANIPESKFYCDLSYSSDTYNIMYGLIIFSVINCM